MSDATAHLGACPHCDTTIPRRHALIAYETSDGPAVYAECPDCRDVVHPA